VEFISTYGFPHSPSNRNSQNEDQNKILQEMRTLSNHLRSLIINAQRTNKMIYIFGDLQDTPDITRTFAYGNTRLPKHPLGIVKTCEDLGLECTIYQHLASMKLPVISRHGSKGGRFIDGMYTLPQYLTHITGIVIISDTGVYSDHNLVISKCDLGLTKFSISKKKEERIDYRRVMAIPVKIYKDQNHPTLRDDVYKGLEFQDHANLYHQLQKITNGPQLNFLQRVTNVKEQLQTLEQSVIKRTQESITRADQDTGKLISRLPSDATTLNMASRRFFKVIGDICTHAGLSKLVPVVNNPLNRINRKK
jgi:hypothetical protein